MLSPYAHADIEKAVRGFPKLATEMAMYPENAIFRRFGALNARNLLYYQSELTGLEKQLMKIETKDSESELHEKNARSRDYFWISHWERAKDGDLTQYDLVMKMRILLREYNEALYYVNCIHDLPEADPPLLQHLQLFLSCEPLSLPFRGNDHRVYGSCSDPDGHVKDGLIAMGPRNIRDIFTTRLSDGLALAIAWYDKFVALRKEGEIKYYNPSYLQNALEGWMWCITGLMAAIGPVGTIYALRQAQSLEKWLCVVAVNTVVAMAFFSLFTLAKRKDMVLIVALFTLIQVVFLGKRWV